MANQKNILKLFGANVAEVFFVKPDYEGLSINY